MSLLAALLPTLSFAATDLPRECPHCGIYAGPNAFMVLDPYLRRDDKSVEF